MAEKDYQNRGVRITADCRLQIEERSVEVFNLKSEINNLQSPFHFWHVGQ